MTPGMQIVGIADSSVAGARQSCLNAGWTAERIGATSLTEALRTGASNLTDDIEGLVASGVLEVLVEATGDPAAGIMAFWGMRQGLHLIMVNVEADAVAGPPPLHPLCWHPAHVAIGPAMTKIPINQPWRRGSLRLPDGCLSRSRHCRPRRVAINHWRPRALVSLTLA